MVAAQASATGGDEAARGDNPWGAGKVWLGVIAGDGLFVPPTGGVYRKTTSTTIPPYSGHAQDNGILDTTSDGSISVALTNIGGRPVVPACVIVAPQDNSPHVGPGHINNSTTRDFFRETRTPLGKPTHAALSGIGYSAWTSR